MIQFAIKALRMNSNMVRRRRNCRRSTRQIRQLVTARTSLSVGLLNLPMWLAIWIMMPYMKRLVKCNIRWLGWMLMVSNSKRRNTMLVKSLFTVVRLRQRIVRLSSLIGLAVGLRLWSLSPRMQRTKRNMIRPIASTLWRSRTVSSTRDLSMAKWRPCTAMERRLVQFRCRRLRIRLPSRSVLMSLASGIRLSLMWLRMQHTRLYIRRSVKNRL